MKTLTLVLTSLLLAACGSSGGGSGSTIAASPAIVPSQPTPTPTPAPPAPTPTPTPAPTYTCANHPLSGHTVKNVSTSLQFTFSADCSYTFVDSHIMAFGTWTPDSNPAHVFTDFNIIQFPLNLAPSSAYICMPANGPQNCSNSSFAGDVVIQTSYTDVEAGLVVIF